MGLGPALPAQICEINPRESPRIPRSHFQSGDQILKPGDNPDKFFVIEKGTASVIAEGDGDPVLHLGPGEFFAENELARAGDRRFSMRADEPLDVLTIEHGPFQDFLRHLHQLRTASNDRIKRLDALSELREVVRKHPGLGHASAGDAMPKQLPTLGVSASFASAISHFQQKKRTAFVVVDDRGRLQGICTVTDLHNALCGLRSLSTPLSEIMSRPVVTIRQSEPLSRAMSTFLLEPVKRLVVVKDDDDAWPVGLLTLFDVVLHYASSAASSEASNTAKESH